MVVLLVAALPMLVGFGLIALIARYAPSAARPHAAGSASDGRPEIASGELAHVLAELLAALGLETVFSATGAGGVLDVTARDPRPLAGGRILVHARPRLAPRVGVAEVLSFAEGVRSEAFAQKGIFVALAGFTDEARAGAGSLSAPVELVDAAKLLELVEGHVPARAASLARHRGFGDPAAMPLRSESGAAK